MLFSLKVWARIRFSGGTATLLSLLAMPSIQASASIDLQATINVGETSAGKAWGENESSSGSSESEHEEEEVEPEVAAGDNRGRCCAICGAWSSEAIP